MSQPRKVKTWWEARWREHAKDKVEVFSGSTGEAEARLFAQRQALVLGKVNHANQYTRVQVVECEQLELDLDHYTSEEVLAANTPPRPKATRESDNG